LAAHDKAALILLGALLFCLSEYGVHRFAFHAPPRPPFPPIDGGGEASLHLSSMRFVTCGTSRRVASSINAAT
jgi:hypothetical protein